MCFSILQPYEFYEIIDTLNNILKLNKIIKDNKLDDLKLKKETKNELSKFNEYVLSIFDMDKLKQNTLNDFKVNFFIKGIFKDIDDISDIFQKQYIIMKELKIKFENILKEKDKSKTKPKLNQKDIIQIDNTSEGYYLFLSKIRYNCLVKNKLITDDLIVKELKSGVKIFIKDNKHDNKDIKDIEDDLLYLVKTQYQNQIKIIHTTYNKLFIDIVNYISEIDYVTSNAITSKKYNYSKPNIISNSNNSNISCKQLRHPIVERIIDYEYIPHDVSIGSLSSDKRTNLKGMLIYGLNSSGKSVLMKAIGLSVVMAQCGMYVPACEYTLSPYKSLYTRITGNDNIFKGLSSFNLEMTELSIILKRANQESLIIGDEICRGTEHISGNALVASSIVHLSKKNASFVFATHLHELIHLECIKKLENVKAYHLSVDYDATNDMLIYDRKLKEGSGDKIYGIVVAKYIIKNNEFMELTNQIKNELTQSFDTMISGKTSRYNSSVYVYKCEICGINDVNSNISPRGILETHHINEQKDCVDGFSKNKPHIQKNSKANLIVICEKCHDKVHNKEINIEGYVMTSSGKKPKVKKI
jgi:DNA mismatch repair protein MutS